MKFIQLYNEYDYLISFFVPIIIWIFAFFTKKLAKLIKKYKLKNILRLKNADTDIIVPVRPGHLKLKTDVAVTEVLSDFITYNEAFAMFDIDRLIRNVDNICETLGDQTLTTTVNIVNNKFCIGGPLANQQVAQYFRQYFSTVKFGHPPNTTYLTEKNITLLSDLIFKDSSDEFGTIQLNNTVFKFNRKTEGYIILIRMTNDSFNVSNHGTVHICFGNNALTARCAAKCYNIYYDELYKRLKHRKTHYFVIIKCSSSGVADFNTFRDLTDEVFNV